MPKDYLGHRHRPSHLRRFDMLLHKRSVRHQFLLVLSRVDLQIISDGSYALRILRYGYKTGCHFRILNLASQRHDAGRGFDMDIVGIDALASGKGCLHLCRDFRIS